MLVCAFVAAAAIVGSAQGVRKIDVSKLGPQVGAKVPDFNLADQQGKKRTLQSVMGPNGAMIVFYRSADWCPYCKTQLLELQSQYDSLRKDGLGLVGISYDSQEILAAFTAQQSNKNIFGRDRERISRRVFTGAKDQIIADEAGHHAIPDRTQQADPFHPG